MMAFQRFREAAGPSCWERPLSLTGRSSEGEAVRERQYARSVHAVHGVRGRERQKATENPMCKREVKGDRKSQ